MKAVPGTLKSGGASFATTHWSVVANCQADPAIDSAEAQAAVAQLCRDYWPPLYTFVRRRGYPPADAQDLVQGFFTHFLEKRIYTKTDSGKGKFRTFLLAALKNYIADSWAKVRTEKRGGSHLFAVLEAETSAVESLYANETIAPALGDEWHYEQRWARLLVERALEQLQHDFRGEKQTLEKLRPFICGGARLPRQEEIAQQLGISVETLRSHLSRLRARYRAHLREEVARTIGTADDVDEELRQLTRILVAAA